jgi:hypothetical protein
MNDQDWINEIKIGYIRAEGKMFLKFIEEMEEDCFGYKLIPKIIPERRGR